MLESRGILTHPGQKVSFFSVADRPDGRGLRTSKSSGPTRSVLFIESAEKVLKRPGLPQPDRKRRHKKLPTWLRFVWRPKKGPK